MQMKRSQRYITHNTILIFTSPDCLKYIIEIFVQKRKRLLLCIIMVNLTEIKSLK